MDNKNNVLQDLQFYRDVITCQKFRCMQAKNRIGMFNLVVCNVASLCAATNLVIILNPEDKITVKRGVALTALGFVYFMSLFELLNALALFTGFGARFRHKYRLSYVDVLDIAIKLTSTIQAILCCVTGVIVCMRTCTDFIKCKHYISESYAWFGAAYFYYDIWCMYMIFIQTNTIAELKHQPFKNDQNGSMSPSDSVVVDKCHTSFWSFCRHSPLLVMHHLFVGCFGFILITYLRGGFGDCLFGFVYLTEFSTPFVSIRAILSRMKLNASKAYLVNGIMMLITFFVCRLVTMPYVFVLYRRALGTTNLEAIRTIPTSCKIIICIQMIPQLYWFYLMFTGAFKMLVRGSSSPSPKEPIELQEGGNAKKLS